MHVVSDIDREGVEVSDGSLQYGRGMFELNRSKFIMGNSQNK